MEQNLPFKYLDIVADAGYESEENYLFIKENGQVSYIKPANYEISKTRKYKQDISRMENMDYDEANDCYYCKNGKTLTAQYEKQEKTTSGYQRTVTVYQCCDCAGCPYKIACIKGNHCKTPMAERQKSCIEAFRQKVPLRTSKKTWNFADIFIVERKMLEPKALFWRLAMISTSSTIKFKVKEQVSIYFLSGKQHNFCQFKIG